MHVCSQLGLLCFALSRDFLPTHSTMEPSEIQSLIEELQSASLDVDSEQIANARTTVAVIEDMTAQKCREVIRLANRGPVLQWHMSDCWSCGMGSRAAAAHGEIRVVWFGRMRTEFLLQRSIVKCRTGDQSHMAVKV